MMDESTDKYSAPPPSYSQSGAVSHSTTTTTSTGENVTLGFNKEYIKTIPGILKIVQALCGLVCLIVASLYAGAANGWGGFVAGWVLFCALLFFFLYLFNIVSKFPPLMILIEWVYYLVVGICFVIASILACVAAVHYPGMGAYAFFGFVGCGAVFFDLFLQFRLWRSVGHTSQHTTTTTTTSTSEEVRY